jgi:hypothetical protein
MINFFIDESGSFVPADFVGAWNAIAAFVVPNPDLRKCDEALRNLKLSSGVPIKEECKLGRVSQVNLLKFLDALAETRATLFCVATDAGLQTADEIGAHRDRQAEKITEHEDKMLHPEGAQALRNLSAQVRALSPQLYLQLVGQTELIADALGQSIMYYVQRIPKQLNGFRWRIDEKAPGTNNFEETFRTIVPPVLQSKSLKKPGIHVTDFDYSAMASFVYTKDDAPTYLRDSYGISAGMEGGLKLHKIIWEDFIFADSKVSLGLQVADLLASSLRRCLRGEFENNNAVATGLGRLMIQTVDKGYPIRFITIAADRDADATANTVSYIFRKNQKTMLL